MTSVHEWMSFLRGTNGVAGFPLVVAGAGLMLFGWRLWKICVMLAFGVIFTLVGATLIGPTDDQWPYALAGGAALGLLSYWSVNQAVSVLGGLIGGGLVMFSLGRVGLEGTMLWIAGGSAFVACTAYAYLNRQLVVILVTAFLGSLLLLSGITAWTMVMPAIYQPLYGFATTSIIAVPFMILVTTVMSSFYQSAEVRRVRLNAV